MTTNRSVLSLAAGGVLLTAFAVAPAQVASATTVPATALSTAAVPATATAKTAVSAASKKYWKTHYCYGRTVSVDDGDTIRVKLTKGCFGWKKGKTVIVRNASIQATEIKHPGSAAECWSSEAWSMMRKQFPKKSRVRLGAYTKTLSGETTADGKARYVMYAYSYHPHAAGGPWLDAQAKLVASGLAFPKGEHIEAAHNIKYLKLAEEALKNKRGMWGAASHCGAHTSNAKLVAWTGWKTNGRDTKATANTEWFKVRNVGTVPVPLYHWQMRDGSHTFGGGKHKTFVIEQHVTLEPGQVMTLYPGAGTSRPASLVWYNNHPRLPFYQNAGPTPPSDKNAGKYKSTAETGYVTLLMDPSDNMRAASMYPCVYACSKPSIRITSVDPKGGQTQDETATVTNTGRTAVDMTGIVIQVSSARHEFRAGSYLQPGEQIVVHFDRSGTDTPTAAYFTEHSSGTLNDHGGKVWLRTADATTLSLTSWGNGGTYVF